MEMYKDLTHDILQQMKSGVHPKLILHGKQNYYLFCVKVDFRMVKHECLEWVSLNDLLNIDGDMIDGMPVAGRLLDLLAGKGAKLKLVTMG